MITQPLVDIRSFVLEADWPRTADELIDSDQPLLSFKATTFSDATLVAFSWSHIAMDGFGMMDFLHNLQLVLSGQVQDVVPVLGARRDVTVDATQFSTDMPPKKFPFEQQETGAPFNSGLEERVVTIPGDVFLGLRREVEDKSDEKSKAFYRFMSDDELLVAWVIQQVSQADPESLPMTIMHLLNSRFILPSLS